MQQEYEDLLQKAINAGKNRKYKLAIQLLTQIVCNTDHLPIALLYLGRSYHAIGQFEKAISILEFYLKIKPDSVQGNFFTGRSYLAFGLYKEAIFKLKKVITVRPDFFVAHSYIGLAFLKLKIPEIAITHLETAHTLAPENENIFNGYLNALLVKAIKYYHRGHLDEARQIFEFILQHRENAFLPHLYLSRIFKELGKYTQALAHNEIVCQLSPDDPLLKLQKASLLLLLGKKEVAFEELKSNSLLEQFPSVANFTPAMILKFTAFSYFQQNEFKQAIYYGKKILKENYRDHDIHAIVAESYSKIGEKSKAKNHYMRCLEIKYTPEIHYAILLILWELNEYRLLLAQVKKMLQKNEQDKIAGYFYALVLLHTNAPPEIMIQELQKQIQSSGPDFLLMSNLGQIYYKYDFPELAESWLIRTLKLRENDELSLLTLIDVYIELKKPKSAIKYFKMYYKSHPDSINSKKKYINLLILEKQYHSAINELNLIIPYEPQNKNLKRILSNCYISSNKYDEAIVILKDLLKEKPDSLNLFQSLVFCLEMTRRRFIAINLIENAKGFFHYDPGIMTTLGVLYFRDKDNEKALKIFRDLIASSPHNWKLYHNLSIIYEKMGNSVFAEKFAKRAKEYKDKQK